MRFKRLFIMLIIVLVLLSALSAIVEYRAQNRPSNATAQVVFTGQPAQTRAATQ